MDDDRDIDELLKHGPWLEQLARSLVRDPHAADDVVQSTWLSAIRRPPGSSTRIRAWLRTVLFNQVRQASRSRERRLRHESLAAPRVSDLDQDMSKANDLRAELTEAFNGLEEPYRTVLRLHFFDGLTSAQIASRLRIPAATVRGQVMRGLQRLRAELERRHPGQSIEVIVLPLLLSQGDRIAPQGSSTTTTRVTRRSWLTNPLVPLSAGLLAGAVWLFVRDTDAAAAVEESIVEAELPPPVNPLESSVAPSSEAARAPAQPVIEPAASVEPAPRAPERLVLEVKVRDASGSKRGDAAVLVFDRSSATFEEIGRTDVHGVARVAIDPDDVGAWGGKGSSGRVALRASAPGWAVSDVVLAASSRGDRPVELVLPTRETVIAGRVVDDEGRAIAAADVELGYAQANQLSGLADADPSLPQPVRVVTDENGRFVADRVDGSGGRVRVHVSREGWLPTFVEQAVDGERERDCTIVMTSGGTVRGRVRSSSGDAVPGARVWYEPAEQGGDAAYRLVGYVPRVRGWCTSTVADEQGSFELRAIPPGPRLLWAQDPADPTRLAYETLEVPRGAAVEWDAELDVRQPFEVVVETGPLPREGWIVRLWFQGPAGRCIREGATDANGVVRFLDVCADKIDVSVFAADTGFLSARSRADRSLESSVRVVLDEPAEIAGRLLDAAGGVFQDGILRLVPKEGVAPWTQLSYDATTGVFEHALPAAAYVLIASHAGSNVPVAEFSLAPGMRHDLGALRLPKQGRVRIDGGGVAAPPGLEYRILQSEPALPPAINPRVEVGSWPPPEERAILPGKYALEIGSFLAKEMRVDRRVEIEIAEGELETVRVAR